MYGWRSWREHMNGTLIARIMYLSASRNADMHALSNAQNTVIMYAKGPLPCSIKEFMSGVWTSRLHEGLIMRALSISIHFGHWLFEQKHVVASTTSASLKLVPDNCTVPHGRPRTLRNTFRGVVMAVGNVISVPSNLNNDAFEFESCFGNGKEKHKTQKKISHQQRN
jgi:hypothetical protein